MCILTCSAILKFSLSKAIEDHEKTTKRRGGKTSTEVKKMWHADHQKVMALYGTVFILDVLRRSLKPKQDSFARRDGMLKMQGYFSRTALATNRALKKPVLDIYRAGLKGKTPPDFTVD